MSGWLVPVSIKTKPYLKRIMVLSTLNYPSEVIKIWPFTYYMCN